MTDATILERVMLAFEGERVPRWVERRLADGAGGRGHAVPGVQRPRSGPGPRADGGVPAGGAGRAARRGEAGAAGAGGEGGAGGAGAGGPLLVAADQEAGQLMALGDATTGFAGNMALGAVGDEGLAERIGTPSGARHGPWA